MKLFSTTLLLLLLGFGVQAQGPDKSRIQAIRTSFITDRTGRPDGIELIVPDWFYRAVLDDALVLTIDRAYFGLTGGLDRWLYRIVRKHGGRQRRGWRFDLRHLHQKSGSLSPFKRFAFEVRDIVRRQPLPGYVLALEVEVGGRTLLAFEPAAACGQAVEPFVLSGTETGRNGRERRGKSRP